MQWWIQIWCNGEYKQESVGSSACNFKKSYTNMLFDAGTSLISQMEGYSMRFYGKSFICFMFVVFTVTYNTKKCNHLFEVPNYAHKHPSCWSEQSNFHSLGHDSLHRFTRIRSIDSRPILPYQVLNFSRVTTIDWQIVNNSF